MAMGLSASASRAAIRAAHHRPEAEAVALLLRQLDGIDFTAASAHAATLIEAVRRSKPASPVDALMRQYDLSSAEGLALMELAEALLRIPDAATRDRLIHDKIGGADWKAHAGRSSSPLVNLATTGLRIGAQLTGIPVARTLVRGAVGQTIKQLGDRFVYAESIGDALEIANRQTRQNPLIRQSFDMLGEAARTYADAANYRRAYDEAIATIDRIAPPGGVNERPGISVKLSALHPRYELPQKERVLRELLPVVLELAEQAAKAGIGFTIDAEEADRLDLSLDIFEALAVAPALAGWDGLGLALQAYGKRALPVIDWLQDLAQRANRQIALRLVKGAYWDSEIKRAQQEGLADYPVYTRKEATDLSYLACARRMLNVGDAFYPMFATHNAFTIAAIRQMAGERRDYEFQRLHGMGELLHQALDAGGIPCRIYAPVGLYPDLLAYLVRRLLENGANSSFVNQISDARMAVEILAASPVDTMRAQGAAIRNPRLPMPTALYENRDGAPGVDFGDPVALETLSGAVRRAKIDHHVKTIDPAKAVQSASRAYLAWAAMPVEKRAAILRRAVDQLVAERDIFIALLVHEAKRTIRNAVGEWREAVDFLRYYADDAQRLMQPRALPGPTGESNTLYASGKGVFACISPWNFPLSIFTGQVAAALVTGNAVIAKPAPETPLIAQAMVRLLHEAGVPKDVLHCAPGGGEIGAALVSQPEIAGVVFTGSTATARKIAQALAAKEGSLATLIAETGGQNALIVDSSALLEQVTGDAIASAFDSAGQRCSALRILAVQEDVADRLIELLTGAMATLVIGDPANAASDIGPVIHDAARTKLEQHLAEVVATYGKILATAPAGPTEGSYFAPRLIEIDRIDRLKHEVFGPILHIVRWRAGGLEELVRQINATGYGLTLGLETRIADHIDIVRAHARVGNLYVNRSQIGAVVETQPFGGEGLSGTGPKAGGPHYLTRFITERVVTINTAATGGNAELLRG